MLSPVDERGYVTAMVANTQAASLAFMYSSTGSAPTGAGCCGLLDERLLVDVLCSSQQHIRSCGQAWDVSLRDVRRCLKLARWEVWGRGPTASYVDSKVEPRGCWTA